MGILDTIGGTTFAVGFQGQLFGDANKAIIETRVNENATAIDVGVPVCRGAAVSPGVPLKCKPLASGGKVCGFSLRALSEMNADSTGTVTYAQNKELPVLKRGYLWVKAVENVTDNDDVIGVVAAPSGAGGTTGGAADGTTRLAMDGGTARWCNTVTSGNVGLVSANLA